MTEEVKVAEETKTFTQEDLDKIISERISKTKEKFEAEIAKLKEDKAATEEEDLVKKLEKERKKLEKEINDKAEARIALETEIKKKALELGVPELLLKSDTIEGVAEKASAFEELLKSKVSKKPEINTNKKAPTAKRFPVL